MRTVNRYGGNEKMDKNLVGKIYVAITVLLILIFIASCIYIGINGFLSRL